MYQRTYLVTSSQLEDYRVSSWGSFPPPNMGNISVGVALDIVIEALEELSDTAIVFTREENNDLTN